jgi:hypothetical protein
MMHVPVLIVVGAINAFSEAKDMLDGLKVGAFQGCRSPRRRRTDLDASGSYSSPPLGIR